MSRPRSGKHTGRGSSSSRRRGASIPVVLLLACGRVLGVHGAEQSPPSADASPSLRYLADALDLEELGRIPVESVSTPSRFEQKVTEAPASVSVITAQDFKRFGYRTLADALQGVRGVWMGNGL